MSTNPYGDPSGAPASGGGGGKILLGMGLGCLLIVVLCCGGFFLFGFGMARWAQDAASEDPVVVVETAATIAELDMPVELEPQMSMSLKVPFTGQVIITMAVFADDDDSNTSLVLMQTEMPEMDQQQMIRQFEDSMNQQGQQQTNIEIKESETVTVTVRDQPSQFTFAKGPVQGEEGAEAKEYWRVSGSFQGRGGPGGMIMTLPADKYDRQRVQEIVESIH